MFQRLKSLFAPKPPRQSQHPEFGVLTLDSELWSGEAERNGRTIRFCIDGTDTAPDERVLDRVRELLNRFAEVERKAIDFLRAHAPNPADCPFEFYSINLLWADQPHLYTLEFTLPGDEDGIWRVEFENDQPKHLGRDD